MSQNITPLLLGMMIMMMSSSFASAFLIMGGASGASGDSGASGASGDSGGSGSLAAAIAAAQPTEITPVWNKKSNKKITGGTFLKYVDEGSLGPCKTECFEDKDCTGFTYQHFGKKCSLYGGDIDFKSDLSLTKSSQKIIRQYE